MIQLSISGILRSVEEYSGYIYGETKLIDENRDFT
jgi:hypothetical protein